MKKTLSLAFFASLCAAATAHADIDRLNVHFAGGCVRSNVGTCVISVRADGHNFERDALQLYLGPKTSLKLASPNRRALTATGYATYRVKNIPGGCFQVRTAPNGNDRPDHASAILCEK